MNGYGEPPHDDGTSVPPGWNAWYGTVNQDKTHYFYGYRMNANGTVVGPFGDPGSWHTREYGIRDELGCPLAASSPLRLPGLIPGPRIRNGMWVAGS